MGASMSLEERVLRFIRDQAMAAPGERLLVAVSGGPDSVCLLHLLHGLSPELGIQLHAAHLDHGLRGGESEADAEYVAELAAGLGIPVTVDRRDVPAYRAANKLSLEEAAREVRYAFLAETAVAAGAKRVAAGHTADDHIETVLMHLVRGSGTRGLRGLQPVSVLPSVRDGLTVVRPLLTVSREETVAYCTRHRLEPRTDSSNLSLSPLRNRIRRQLLPLLREYNPAVGRVLLRTARIAAEDIAFIEAAVGAVWDGAVSVEKDAVILDKKKFLALPPALQRNLLRTAVERLAGNIRDIEMRHIDIIMGALDRPAGRRLDLPSGLVFSIDYDRYAVSRGGAESCPWPELDGEVALNVPGETVMPGWRVKAGVASPEEAGEGGPYRACLDLDRTGERLTVRSRRPGDRFQPLGMEGEKKLGEFMIDARIPRAWRKRVPLVCSPEHIVWVAGWRPDGRVRVTENTRRVLCLEFVPA